MARFWPIRMVLAGGCGKSDTARAMGRSPQSMELVECAGRGDPKEIQISPLQMAFFNMFLSKRERPTGGKKWTWTRPFARPRPSSTTDEGGSAVPNSRLITAVIWISRIPMDITGPLGSTQTTTTATAMRQKTRPPRNQTRAEWEMEWKARRKRWELWRAIVSIMSGELRSSSGFAVVTRRTAPVG